MSPLLHLSSLTNLGNANQSKSRSNHTTYLLAKIGMSFFVLLSKSNHNVRLGGFNIYLRKYIGKSSSYLSSRPSQIKSFAHRILEEVGKSFCFLQSKSFKPNQFFGDNNAYCTSESKRVVFVCQVFQIKFERKYSYFSIYRWRHVARGHYHLLPTVQREVSIIIYCQLYSER